MVYHVEFYLLRWLTRLRVDINKYHQSEQLDLTFFSIDDTPVLGPFPPGSFPPKGFSPLGGYKKFTRIPVTRLNELFMLLNVSQCNLIMWNNFYLFTGLKNPNVWRKKKPKEAWKTQMVHRSRQAWQFFLFEIYCLFHRNLWMYFILNRICLFKQLLSVKSGSLYNCNLQTGLRCNGVRSLIAQLLADFNRVRF